MAHLMCDKIEETLKVNWVQQVYDGRSFFTYIVLSQELDQLLGYLYYHHSSIYSNMDN